MAFLDPPSGFTRIATDDFTRGNESPVTGNWSSFTGTGLVNTNLYSNALVTATANSGSIAMRTGEGVPSNADQYSEVLTKNINIEQTDFPGGAVRVNDSANNFYVSRTFQSGTSTYYDIYKCVSDSWTALKGTTYIGGTDVTNNKWFGLKVVGNVLTPYYSADGSSRTNLTGATDSAIPAAGYNGAYTQSNNNTLPVVEEWAGGDASTVAGQPTMARWGGVPFMAVNKGVW